MRRRAFVRGVGAGSVAGLTGVAGCLTRTEDDEEPAENNDDPLRVATYTSMVTGETPAGTWLADAFEEATDAEIDWRVPEAGIEHFVRRHELEAEIGADVYLGLTVGELVRADDAFGRTDGLFEPLDRSRLEHDGRIRDELSFEDPADRVLPFDSGYVTLVADETELETMPESFEDLVDEEYAESLLAQNPRSSDPGLAFLLWTIAEYGDDYLDYWGELRDNGVQLFESWTGSYRERYLEGERPLVVSYSTDQVGAAAAERDLDRHRITTLDGQGYEVVEGVAVFADGGRKELAYEFVDFLLSPEAQAEIATRNVQYPAVDRDYVALGSEFESYAREPSESVTTTYEELRGNLEEWLTAWSDAYEWEVADVARPYEDEDADDAADGDGEDEDGDEENGGDADGDGDDDGNETDDTPD